MSETKEEGNMSEDVKFLCLVFIIMGVVGVTAIIFGGDDSNPSVKCAAEDDVPALILQDAYEFEKDDTVCIHFDDLIRR